MIRRGAVLSLVVFVCAAASARPEAVAIDHKAVGCIVVGQFPKMNACFTPAADLARSRVYFRPEGASGWYYVEMKADQPCFAGTLPKPGKKLVGKKIEYYVEAQNKTFEPARTAEFAPIVVKSAQECKKEVPVAPFLNNATVAVFPALPAGFVGGGIGTAAVVGIAAAGAAAAGTAVAGSSNNDATTTTTVAVGGNTTTTTLAPATTTTTTTTPPKTNKAPFAVLTTNPDPPSGPGPLTVTFDLCKSTDPDGDPLSFFFDFGDGSKASGSCVESHTYQASFRETAEVRRSDRSYVAEACVVDTGNLSACRSRNVSATSPPPPCPAPTGVSITAPKAGQCFSTPNVPVSATATGANSVLFRSDEIDCKTMATTEPDEASTTVTGPGPTYSTTFTIGTFPTSTVCYRIKARALTSCGAFTDAASVQPVIVQTPFCFLPVAGEAPAATAWSSDLALEKGRLQFTVNGGEVLYEDSGRSYGTSRLADGENRFEATLVAGAGKPGLWRFDLVDAQAAGTIRILSGDVVSVTSNSVTFRLQGTPGERVAFTFLRK
jgi:hypothetical protein